MNKWVARVLLIALVSLIVVPIVYSLANSRSVETFLELWGVSVYLWFVYAVIALIAGCILFLIGWAIKALVRESFNRKNLR